MDPQGSGDSTRGESDHGGATIGGDGEVTRLRQELARQVELERSLEYRIALEQVIVSFSAGLVGSALVGAAAASWSRLSMPRLVMSSPPPSGSTMSLGWLSGSTDLIASNRSLTR